MSTYVYQRLQARENHNRALVESIRSGEHSGQLWGAFTGLFGLANNEVIMIRSGTNVAVDNAVESEVLTPTARPESPLPLAKPGLYVFRRFLVKEDSVDEFVKLSVQAWTTFEGADEFAASPQGLFRPPTDQAGNIDMLLVTWYDGFSSWQVSRQPDADAAENFKRRQALTLKTSAIATSLLADA